VLGGTIDRRVAVGLTFRDDNWITLDSDGDVPPVRVERDAIEARTGDEAWANYVLGVLAMLRAEGLDDDTGFALQMRSTLPVGAGLSSSAALEVATACALNEAFAGGFDCLAIAQLARRAENDFVGVPCGLLDQAVVAFGDDTHLVRLDAGTEEVSTVPFPAQTGLWIFRTHETHALADAHYQERYDEARAVRDRLNNLLGDVEHLAEVAPEALGDVKADLPAALYRRARHVITEHRRVQTAGRLLERGEHEAVGDLLFASHESSRVNYENSTEELDFVVDRLRESDQVLGGRLTGAGFGGAAMAWTREGFGEEDARAVAEAYADRFGEELRVLACQPAAGPFTARP
jgi:galactokinase